MRDTGRIDDNDLPTRIGDYSWQTEMTPRHLTMLLPCGHYATLPVAGERAWQWDGNVDEPTLAPSIQCLGTSVNQQPAPCWHGHLTAGEFRSC